MDKSKLECKRNKGKIITKDRRILDQLSDNDNEWYWSGRSSFNIHIKNKYGLSDKEYHNIVVYGNINYSPKCPVCNNDVEFISLAKGYRKYCSRKCTGHNKVTQANRFLSYNYSKAKIYIAELKGDSTRMKVGITGANYNSRQNYAGYYLTNHTYLIEGTPEELVKLEADIDSKFCINNTELFPSNRKDELINYIIEYKKAQRLS